MTLPSPITKKDILKHALMLEVMCNASLIESNGSQAVPMVKNNREVLRQLRRYVTIPNRRWFQMLPIVVPSHALALSEDMKEFLSNEGGGAFFFWASEMVCIVALVHSQNAATAFAIRFSEYLADV